MSTIWTHTFSHLATEGVALMDRSSGWRSDPYAAHELRYFSEGTPTRLVRDNGHDDFDDLPAAGPPPQRFGPSMTAEMAADQAPAPAPGWYVDPTDPGATRFWDGTGWTDRKAPIAPSPSQRVATVPGPEAVAPAAPGQVDPVLAQDGRALTSESPMRALTREASTWVEAAKDAMARALTGGSAAAWRDVVRDAAVVLDVVTATQALLDATDAADQANRALLEATDAAERATEVAERATEVAQDATQAAEAAGREAQAASQAAAAAAQTALDATERAEQVDAAVAQARTQNTPEAWHQAAQLAPVVLETDGNEGTATTDF